MAQAGALFLAGATGHPILPFHIEADRFWTMESWDRTQVPKPFSRVGIVIGAPLAVRDTSSASIAATGRELEQTLVDLERRANKLVCAEAPARR